MGGQRFWMLCFAKTPRDRVVCVSVHTLVVESYFLPLLACPCDNRICK